MPDEGKTAEMTADQELARSGGQAPPEAPASGTAGAGFTPERAFGPDPEEAPKADEPAAPKESGDPPAPAATAEESEATEGEEQSEKPKGKEWDKDRQAKDQELATLRKENAELKAKATTEPENPEEDEEPLADEDIDPLENKTLDELRASLKPLDEFSSNEDIIHNDKVRTKIEEVRALRDWNRRSRSAYNRILAQGDKDFGAEFHNEVVKNVTDLWKSEGFGTTKPVPDPAHTRLAVRAFYAEAKVRKLEKSLTGKSEAKPKAPEKPKTPVLDTGHGGEFGYDATDTPEEGPVSVSQIVDRVMKNRASLMTRRK